MTKKTKSPYHDHRFPATVINCAVRRYWFNLSLRAIEELLLERGVVVTYETIRWGCDEFGAAFAQCAKVARGKPGSTHSTFPALIPAIHLLSHAENWFSPSGLNNHRLKSVGLYCGLKVRIRVA